MNLTYLDKTVTIIRHLGKNIDMKAITFLIIYRKIRLSSLRVSHYNWHQYIEAFEDHKGPRPTL